MDASREELTQLVGELIDDGVRDFLALREEWQHFAEMPEELRRFAANPLHVGFIEIAMQLSQMPTDRLRRVGESILNITM